MSFSESMRRSDEAEYRRHRQRIRFADDDTSIQVTLADLERGRLDGVIDRLHADEERGAEMDMERPDRWEPT